MIDPTPKPCDPEALNRDRALNLALKRDAGERLNAAVETRAAI
jgi:hypothetical protein